MKAVVVLFLIWYLIILSPKKHKMCRFQPAFHYSNQFIKYTWSKAPTPPTVRRVAIVRAVKGSLLMRHRFLDPLYYYPPQILHIDSVILLLMIPIGILQRPLGVC
ncbi:hypothetical protein DUI87_12231 [Hirundo rustica rustica]|uniref:Secreted protein n=1 Tax=Hirundo rustica rustica TaxID=333673 RepID=A0A3M0KD03_HIRRU|nr:hypothetical protein DUI87_12231 [Hirundo rustica rustica]